MESNEVEIKKKKTKKVVLFSLGTLALGTLAFFGFKHFTKPKKNNNDEIDQTTDDLDTKTSFQTPAYSKPRTGLPSPGIGDAFPLRIGSKGDKVRTLQQALIRTYGAGILKNHGADGDLGTETRDALRSKGYGVPLSETEFNKITGKKEEAQTPPPPLLKFDPVAIAKALYTTIVTKDFSTSLTLLKAIKSTTDYSLVSEQLKNNYRIAGVRQTLVNAALTTFTESSQKAKVQEAFKNMGLKYDGTKWSLSGLDGLPKPKLKTKKECTIYTHGQKLKIGMTVPKGIVIGTMIATKGLNTHFRLFDKQGQHFYVPSECVETTY